MKHASIFLVSLLVFIAKGKECPPNQTYNDCGTACPLNCTGLYSGPIPCTMQCVPGCFCNPGYVLNDEKRCILESECPKPKCPPTQVFDTCGSACPLTCDNYQNPPICSLQCVPRCTCERGYVFNSETQRCVLPKECPQTNTTCPPGEVFSECDNPCLPSCEIPDTTDCRFLVCNKGCVCKEGLIRHHATGRCIPKKFCPVSCNDENAVRSRCAPKCPPTCQHKYLGWCSKECRPGCVCKGGYTKDEISGNCVLNESCPRCGINEVYKECGTKCPKTCANKDALIKCVAGCQAGCFCKDNYVRNEATGECVFPDQCPQCDKNETYAASGIDCATCSNYKIVFCPPKKEWKCYCSSGYVRDDFTGKCILTQDCPQEKCGANETYADEGIDCATCSNYKYVRCALEHERKCYCLPGYIREDVTRRCILSQDCPQEQCKKKNEEYVACDPGPCEPTCQHTEPKICSTICKLHGCRCKEGFLRDNSTKECVPAKDCQ